MSTMEALQRENLQLRRAVEDRGDLGDQEFAIRPGRAHAEARNLHPTGEGRERRL